MSRRSGDFDWGAWLLPGVGLLVAAVVVLFTVLQPTEQRPPTQSPAPSASQGDEHEVVTDEGTVSFRLENDAIVVGLTTAAGTSELGRVTLPFWATAPPGGTPIPTGTALFVMVCGRPEAPDARRYVFGHLDTAQTAQYSGPDAIGHGTSDGLFLFALRIGAAPGPIMIRTGDGSGAGVPADAFDSASSDGTAHPSGCNVAG